MPFINIRIEGLNEVIQGLNNMVSSSASTKQSLLEEASSFMANEMRNNVHVITGNLKSSIGSFVVGDRAEVFANAEYAFYENRRIGGKRPGPHDFADKAAAALINRLPQMIQHYYGNTYSNL